MECCFMLYQLTLSTLEFQCCIFYWLSDYTIRLYITTVNRTSQNEKISPASESVQNYLNLILIIADINFELLINEENCISIHRHSGNSKVCSPRKTICKNVMEIKNCVFLKRTIFCLFIFIKTNECLYLVILALYGWHKGKLLERYSQFINTGF